jgi:hypothetical protein
MIATLATGAKSQFYTEAQLIVKKRNELKEIHAGFVRLGKKIPPSNPRDFGSNLAHKAPWIQAILDTQKKWAEAQEKASGTQLSLFDALPANTDLEEKSSVLVANLAPAASGSGEVPVPVVGDSDTGDQSEEAGAVCFFGGPPAPAAPASAPAPVPPGEDEGDELLPIEKTMALSKCGLKEIPFLRQ